MKHPAVVDSGLASRSSFSVNPNFSGLIVVRGFDSYRSRVCGCRQVARH